MADWPVIDSSPINLIPADWQIQPRALLPAWLIETLQLYNPLKGEKSSKSAGSVWGQQAWGSHVAQLLWQRGLRDPAAVEAFLNPDQYRPASPFEFAEMEQAIQRLEAASTQQETVAIWGDFDADGVTATSVLWEGLGHWIEPDKLQFYIPNRFTESHGLSANGIQQLASTGVTLIVTCDTGSTHFVELELAQSLGIDVIVTDHHSLTPQRPPVTALINPRSLPSDHPLADLSGVAVAYKLIEALQAHHPRTPDPLPPLLELVAIGLIADLVALKRDSRYLAQVGLRRLQLLSRHPERRPGVAELLKRCQRSGDRPTDISFGIGPRINAVSRIQGDAGVCVELLTTRDPARARQLAEQVELLNTRRRAIQRSLEQTVRSRLETQDLSTTAAIVLAEEGWPIGVLGLVAGQIAQTYHRPTVLLSLDAPNLDWPDLDSSDLDPQDLTARAPAHQLARGSARSVNGIDFYPILESQRSLLERFGGHPYAAGLSLKAENLELFTEGLNRELRLQLSQIPALGDAPVTADLEVTVADLGQPLFRELKLLEPCGMGNPVPCLLIRNCWFENARHFNLKDARGRQVRYIKTQFEICDATASSGFSGIWWGHYRDELPQGPCDALGELDFNAYKRQYEFRLIAVRPAAQVETVPPQMLSPQIGISPQIDGPCDGFGDRASDWLLDWRQRSASDWPSASDEQSPILVMRQAPRQWDDFRPWLNQAKAEERSLALAYGEDIPLTSAETWRQLLGVAKYLSRTGETVEIARLQNRLGLDRRLMELAWGAIADVGFEVYHLDSQQVTIRFSKKSSRSQLSQEKNVESVAKTVSEAEQFLAALRETNFRIQYFQTVPLREIMLISARLLGNV